MNRHYRNRLNITKVFLALTCFIFSNLGYGQNIHIYPYQVTGNTSDLNNPGLFLVPKTSNGATDFVNNGLQYNSIRLISIETAFDYSSASIASVMSLLEAQKSDILYINSRCSKLILPIMKMPAWLSSSSDTTNIGGGWKVYNGVPPSNYPIWNLLMDSIVNKINNQWGLDPYYEIWNEPDIFYWQGTVPEYFHFFKNTISSIKSHHPNAKVGGPVVSSFNSKFGSSFVPGFLTSAQLDSTIIGRVIDSCVVWNQSMDFISWHQFDSYLYPIEMQMNYLNQKLINSGHGTVPLLLTEWNNTGSLRESHFSAASMINSVQCMKQFQLDAQMVAAWQDFDEGLDEFHNDYGLVSWADLHKPEWKALRLLAKMQGQSIAVDTSNYLTLSVSSSIQNDTLRVLISNVSFPGSTVATSQLMYGNQFTAWDLYNAGYTGTTLDSIYKGYIVLTGTDALSTAINSVIPVYQEAQTNLLSGRSVQFTINGLNGVYTGLCYTIDSMHNNIVHVYDSLITAGYNRTTATNLLYPNHFIDMNAFTLNDSILNFSMAPNSVKLFEIYIPGISASLNENVKEKLLNVFPNPTKEILTVIKNNTLNQMELELFNVTGNLVKSIQLNEKSTSFSVLDLDPGIYYGQIKQTKERFRFVKL